MAGRTSGLFLAADPSLLFIFMSRMVRRGGAGTSGGPWKSNGAHGLIMKQYYENGTWNPNMSIDKYREKIWSKTSQFHFQTNHESFRNAKSWWNSFKVNLSQHGANRESKPSEAGQAEAPAPAEATPKTEAKEKEELVLVEGVPYVKGDCSWPLLWSRWSDIVGNEYLYLFVILPSGVLTKDATASIVGAQLVEVDFSWPAIIHDPERLYQGMQDSTGKGVSSSDPKYTGLIDGAKLLKKSQTQRVSSKLVIKLPKPVEPNFVSPGGVPGVPTFHKNTETNNPYPTLIMTIGLLEKRYRRAWMGTTQDDNGFSEDEDEDEAL